MAKPEQVLIIDPQNELRFRGPFNAPVTSYMKLTNPSDKKVLFKIKTTAPKKYCVRPNSGVLDPGCITEIAISLQPFVFDSAEKNKHKFMVQTVFAPDAGDINLDQLWKDIGPDQLMDSKLKCVFEMPPDYNEANNLQAGGQQQDENNSNLGNVNNATSALLKAEQQQQTGPANKASPKPASGGASTNFANSLIDPELQKAAEEVQQLREEESSLRQENLRLKEEILQLKMAVGGGGGTAKLAAHQQPNRYAPPPPAQTIPLVYIAVAMMLGFLGIVLGKYVL